MKEGKINILIGTHALFVEDVTFADLACVIIDEQHRFGVHQRLNLSVKGSRADVLVMTATPIPRTLILTGLRRHGIFQNRPASRRAQTG